MRTFRYYLVVAVIVILSTCIVAAQKSQVGLQNPFETRGKWYKANLHTHTTISDGDVAVAERIKQYRDNDYQVLAITDHQNGHQNLARYCDEDFLVLNGMEIHPKCPAGGDYHFVCLNLPGDFNDPSEETAAECIRRVRAAGGEVIYAHPYWLGHNITCLQEVEGYIGIEIFNDTCNPKGFSTVYWDDLLASGRIVSGLAVDDVHESSRVGSGWVMIKAEDLSAGSIMESLRKGCFYSSCGPVIEDFRIEDGAAKVKCSDVIEIYFIGQAYHMHSVLADRNKPLLRWARFELPEGIRYVRCEVVDAYGRRAWTNPLILETK